MAIFLPIAAVIFAVVFPLALSVVANPVGRRLP